jgi:hypothetical protein
MHSSLPLHAYNIMFTAKMGRGKFMFTAKMGRGKLQWGILTTLGVVVIKWSTRGGVLLFRYNSCRKD